MESEPLKSDTLSTLKLQFGSFSDTLPPAINIDLSINLFSTKISNKLFNIAEFIDIKIEENSCIFVIEARDDPDMLAKQLREVILKKEEKINITIIANEKQVYVIFQFQEAEVITGFLNSIIHENGGSNSQNFIGVNIKSENKIDDILKIAEKNGLLSAFLRSLLVSFTFDKNSLTKSLKSESIKDLFGSDQYIALFNSFEHLNAKIDFESSSILENYPNIVKSASMPKLDCKNLPEINKNLFGNKIEIFGSFKPVSLSGTIALDDFHLLLSLISL